MSIRSSSESLNKTTVDSNSDVDVLISLFTSNEYTDVYKACMCADLFGRLFSASLITCSQLCLLIQLIFACYPQWKYFEKIKHFGTYICDFIVAIYPNILDIHNINLVLSQLSNEDIASIYCRIGYLNIFNPVKPEGYYELNCQRYEERQVAKMLLMISFHEPGGNFIFKSFRWKRFMEPIPAWDITDKHLNDETFPSNGIITLKFYSGDRKKVYLH